LAQPAPMPRPDPVMTTALPLNSPMALSNLCS
jgi:hypothetical protein